MSGFSGGRNVAMKIPPDAFEQTVAFYRDVLGMRGEDRGSGSSLVEFGPIRLWLDRVETVSQAEIWLEVTCGDTAAAAHALAEERVVRCAAIEPLPDDFKGFWIKSPAAIVHLVAEPGQDT